MYHKLKRNNKVVPFEQSEHFHYRRAMRNLDANRYLEAVGHLYAAVKKTGDPLDYWMDLACIYTEMGCYDESLRMLLRAAEQYPSTECLYGMACNYWGKKSFENARECLEAYIACDPDGDFIDEAEDLLEEVEEEESLLYEQGMTDEVWEGMECVRTGDWARAEKLFKKALETDSQSVYPWRELARVLFLQRRLSEALVHLAKALKRFEDDVYLRMTSMRILLEQNDVQGAIKHLNRALECPSPDEDEVRVLGITAAQMGLYERALKPLEAALQVWPYDREILHFYALCQWRVGERKQAVVLWETAARVDPEDTIASYYLAMARRGEDVVGTPRHVYQVPADELLLRLEKLRGILEKPLEDTRALWREDASFPLLLRWALMLPDMTIKRTMLEVLVTLEDETADRMIKDLIGAETEPDLIKQDAILAMVKRGVPEPYLAVICGRPVQINLTQWRPDVELDAAYYEVSRLVALRMDDMSSTGEVLEALSLWRRYISTLGKQPAIEASAKLRPLFDASDAANFHMPPLNHPEQWAGAVEAAYWLDRMGELSQEKWQEVSHACRTDTQVLETLAARILEAVKDVEEDGLF